MKTRTLVLLAAVVLGEAEVEGYANLHYLRRTPESFRIDWENSVGFNRISPEAVRATKPAWPFRFRAVAQLDDY